MTRSMFIIFLIAYIIFQSNITMGFVCPEEDIYNGCQPPNTCIYADPDRCYGFIQCTEAGEVFYKQCPIGLRWNDRIKNCVRSRYSSCRHKRSSVF